MIEPSFRTLQKSDSGDKPKRIIVGSKWLLVTVLANIVIIKLALYDARVTSSIEVKKLRNAIEIDTARVPDAKEENPTENETDGYPSTSDMEAAQAVTSRDTVYPKIPRELSGYFPSVEEGTEIQFLPGTLNVSKLEAYRHCHVPPEIYGNNFKDDDIEGEYTSSSFSDKHRLMYIVIGKSGSSSSKYFMEQRFGGRTNEWPQYSWDEYEKFTFTREPLDRFFSSFREAMFHKRPWHPQLTKKEVQDFPFPYLFSGLTSNAHFSETGGICDGDCFRERFERFIKEHDQMNPFDSHLALQVGYLHRHTAFLNGTRVGPHAHELDAMYSTETLNDDWEKIAATRNVKIHDKAKKKKREAERLFDYMTASDDAKKRICRFLSLDYCCLNYPLPDVCEDAGVSCTLRKVEGDIQIESSHIPGVGGVYDVDDGTRADENQPDIQDEPHREALDEPDVDSQIAPSVSTPVLPKKQVSATSPTGTLPTLDDGAEVKEENPTENETDGYPSTSDMEAAQAVTSRDTVYPKIPRELSGYFPSVEEGTEIQFLPGTLNVSKLEAYRHCHVPPEIYGNNFKDDDIEGEYTSSSFSDKHRLMYIVIGKSGSSSSKYFMEQRFGGRTNEWPQYSWDEYEKFTFTREPLDRFFSSFREAMFHKRPWHPQLTKKEVQDFPFPYLFSGLTSNAHFSETGGICDGDCFRERFERFIKEHDQMNPFDSHLALQVGYLHRHTAFLNGTRVGPHAHELDAMYSTETLNDDWEKIAATRNVKIHDKAKKKKREAERLFDYMTASDDAKKRICRFLSLDYCCLNYPLPDVCEDAGVSCTLRKVEGDIQIESSHIPGVGGVYDVDDGTRADENQPDIQDEPHREALDEPDVDSQIAPSVSTPAFPKKQVSATSPTGTLPTLDDGAEVEFLPGTLNVMRLDAFRHCHIPPEIYGLNYRIRDDMEGEYMAGSVSDEHRLMYRMIQKAGSSSSRYIMEQRFVGRDNGWPKYEIDQYEKVTFTRDPLERFFSSFQEAIFRTRPWGPLKNENFTYLYDGLHSGKHWFDGPCDEDCYRERFERFVTEHDQTKPFDIHLHLQVGLLYRYTTYLNGTRVGPEPYPLDAIYSTETLNEDWEKIAASHNITLRSKAKQKKREATRKLFDPAAASDDARRRICRSLSLDYCCLNYRLPDVCEDAGVSCIMRGIDGETRIESAHVPGAGGVYDISEDSHTLPTELSGANGVENQNSSPGAPSLSSRTKLSDAQSDFPFVEEGGEIQFLPGTLNVTRLDAFRQCNVPTHIYGGNFQHEDEIEGEFMPASISERDKMIYIIISKSGSSSSRFIMENRFAAKDQKWPDSPLDTYEVFSFTREPLNRFFSCFQEAMFRKRPWRPYGKMKNKDFPFPYLYTDLSSMEDLSDTGPCDGECFRERFERFVTEHDQRQPFDNHLHLQVGLLHRYTKYRNGTRVGPEPYPLDALYSTETLNEDWEKIAATRNRKIFDKAKQVKRPGLKLFDSATVSDDTKKRICRFLSLDYCCLNYPLPDVCEDAGVSCTLRKVEGEIQIESSHIPGVGGVYDVD